MGGKEGNSICRLCLAERVQLFDVFTSKGIPGWTVADAIMELLRIPVSAGDIYPQWVCIACVGKLEDFKHFKQQCESNKDLLDRAYSGKNVFAEDENPRFHVVVGSGEGNQSELILKEEDLEIPLEKDPLDLNDMNSEIKTEIEDCINESNAKSCTEVNESDDGGSLRVKCEYEDDVTKVDAIQINTPRKSSMETMKSTEEHPDSINNIKEEVLDIPAELYLDESSENTSPPPSTSAIGPELEGGIPEFNDPNQNVVEDSENGVKEEALDICEELDSDRSFRDGTPHIPEDGVTTTKEGTTLGEFPITAEGCSYTGNSVLDSYGPRGGDANGPIGIPDLSSISNIGSEVKVGPLNPISISAEVNPYNCTICEETFAGLEQMEAHMNDHLKLEPFNCKVCNKGFYLIDSLEQHQCLVCKWCKEEFSCISDLKIHKMVHKMPVAHHSNNTETSPNDGPEENFPSNSPKIELKCSECGKVFRDNWKLKMHSHMHSGIKPYKCVDCNKSFSRKEHLKRHAFVHSKKEMYRCEHCLRYFSRNDFLQRHLIIHSQKMEFQHTAYGEASSENVNNKADVLVSSETGIYKCEECCETFSLKETFEKHLMDHSRSKSFKCAICCSTFAQKGGLKKHLVIHSGEKPFACDVCDKAFTRKDRLKLHSVIHSDEKPFVCDICCKGFIRKRGIRRHLRIHSEKKDDLEENSVDHDGGMSFMCEVCGRGFSYKQSLNKHLTLHSGEKPFLCSVCGKAFFHKSGLNAHSMVHSDLKPFACSVCGKGFSFKHILNKHLLIHSGDRPFVCGICGKSYTRKQGLEKHSMVHSGEKPFGCSICCKKFYSKTNLEKHLLVHSGTYECSFCKKTFSEKDSLDKHLITHSGETASNVPSGMGNINTPVILHSAEKPFKCTDCGRGFPWKSSLNKHIMVHSAKKSCKRYEPNEICVVESYE